ncbi:MAG: DsrE family protein [Promethearchaeota archaeon]
MSEFSEKNKNTAFKKNIIEEINFFLTGDAIFSLIDKRMEIYWKEMLNYSKITCFIDSDELKLHGFDLNKKNMKKVSKVNFWEKLITKSNSKNSDNIMGFLQFEGPYMSRNSVHVLKLLKVALLNSFNIHLYSYLDGVHLGHKNQKPSEFENIAKGLIELKNQASEKNLEFLMLACSRCGTARGYIKSQDQNGYYQSDDVLTSYFFCNLNKIIDKFEQNHNIFSKSSILVQGDPKENNKIITNQNNFKTSLLIVISHSPYGSEWTFGGLSFAVACANHGIQTQVLFIENGIYCLFGTHNVSSDDKIFNIQEIINATGDMKNLEYFAFFPSIQQRGMIYNKEIEDLKIINGDNLGNIIFSLQDNTIQKRIFFF